jgi:hypothetical protein
MMQSKTQAALLALVTVIFPGIGFILFILGLDDIVGIMMLAIFLLGVEICFIRKWAMIDVDGYVEVEVDRGGMKTANLVVAGDPETILETKDILVFQVRREETA